MVPCVFLYFHLFSCIFIKNYPELKRESDSKTFDFSKNTIQYLIKDGYQETKEQMKKILARLRELNQ